MVTSYTDAAPGYYNGESLIFEENPTYCRDTKTVATAAGKVQGNTVMGTITSTGKIVPVAPGASDGSQNASCVLINGVDASTADAPGVVWARGVALNGAELNYNGANGGQIATINAALAALGIEVRAGS